MSNQLYIQFQFKKDLNGIGEVNHEFYVVNVWDDYTNHSFEYQTFKEIVNDWKPEKVVQNLMDFEVLDDFVDVLESKKGFYFPSSNKRGHEWYELSNIQVLNR